MRISVILGTRPEIIKMAPIVKALENRGLQFCLIHTGQHYSYKMDRIFFEELELPQPEYNLDVGSGTHGAQTGKLLERIESTLLRLRPDIILVEGDTNSVLAGALAAVKLGIKIGHVEAGLRSFDRTMPEETNRVITDHISDYLFAPTAQSRQNLLLEGIGAEKIFVTGNTIVDAVYQNIAISKKKRNILGELGLNNKEYILATIHRQENVDNRERFKGILEGLAGISRLCGHKIVYPVHPRAKKMIEVLQLQDELKKINNLMLCEPLGYMEFLQLEENAGLIATDSGGIQEEACILGVPCITLRDNTERPETIEAGANMLAGTKSEGITGAARTMISGAAKWENPYGDGNTAKRIVDLIIANSD